MSAPPTCAAHAAPGPCSEDVLWSALFALAVIARDTSRHYVSHMLSLAAAGVLPALQAAMRSYRAAVEAEVGAVGLHCCRLCCTWGRAVLLPSRPLAPLIGRPLSTTHPLPTHPCRVPNRMK